jgi:hypothetical protein
LGILLVGVAAAVFVPVLDCPPTQNSYIVVFDQYSPDELSRHLQALLKGVSFPVPPPLITPCEDCGGRGRISVFRKWALTRGLTKR